MLLFIVSVKKGPPKHLCVVPVEKGPWTKTSWKLIVNPVIVIILNNSLSIPFILMIHRLVLGRFYIVWRFGNAVRSWIM